MLIFGFRVQGFGFKVLGIRIILPTSMLSPHDGRDSIEVVRRHRRNWRQGPRWSQPPVLFGRGL